MTADLDSSNDLRSDLLAVLQKSTEFSGLSDALLDALADEMDFVHAPGGTQVIQEGAASDSMYILVRGRLRVSRNDRNNGLQLFNEINPGEAFGEMGLILQQPRAADITALRDSTLAELKCERYEALISRHPIEFSRVFTQAIYNHLRHTQRIKGESRAQTYAIVPLQAKANANTVARNLTQALQKLGKAAFIPPPEPGNDVNTLMSADLDTLESENKFLVLEADATSTDWTRHVTRLADQIIFVANAETYTEPAPLELSLAAEPGYAMMRKHLVLVHADGTQQVVNAMRWKLGRDVERIYPVHLGHMPDFERLARFLNSQAFGIVLGGGGARGFAHLGVLRAIHEAGIPIDLLGGNSMGALIGALFAYGVPREEIHHQILRFASGGVRPSVPLISILSNASFEGALKEIFGETLIESLWLPFFAAACNLSQANTIILENGPMWRAVLASNSPAGLLPPVLLNGDLLVDGAILENVPVSAMRTRLSTPNEKRRGNGTIIAIDVDVKEEMTVDKELTQITGWDVLKARFNKNAPPVPGIASILMQAGHIGGLALRGRTVAMADYYLEPPVTQFPMMGYKNAEAIIEVGYRHASELISKWKILN